MALTIVRTAYSGVLRDNMDFSTAVADGDGRLVAQGLTLPGHLGSIPTALAAVLTRFAGDIRPGDVFMMNDPFEGGMHLPDIFVFKPVFVDGERLAFAATVCHHTDVGGRVPGSNASVRPKSTPRPAHPAAQALRGGQAQRTIVQIIERNVRVPVRVFGDLRAQLSACHIAERQILELAGRYGRAAVRRHMQICSTIRSA